MFRKNYTCLSDNPDYLRYRNSVVNKENKWKVKMIKEFDEFGYHFEQIYYHIPDTNYWNYIDLKIYKEDKLIATIYRNYHSINYCYARQNGIDYLITSEDYQAITIVNLNTGDIKTYGDWEDIQKGFGFCPIYFDWDESVDDLIIEGCVWACPYEYMKTHISDLSNPDFNTAYYWDDEPEEEEDDDDTDD